MHEGEHVLWKHKASLVLTMLTTASTVYRILKSYDKNPEFYVHEFTKGQKGQSLLQNSSGF